MAKRVLPDYPNQFSRHDFTQPQLFACLVLREHQKKSYRGVEALLRDCPEWRADIGLPRTPDHNTINRAFDRLIKPGRINRALDLTAQWAKRRRMTRGRFKPLSLDSSMFESRHVSRHFEKRQKQTEQQERKNAKKALKTAVNRRRSRVVRRLPKLSLAVCTASHLILAARATTGGGADHPHFAPLLADARQRATVKVVVADAGYDSEANHVTSRQMNVRSIIPPYSGRPSQSPPPTRHRRNMYHRFKRKADRDYYGQRWQSETANSMIKRNLGSALRACTAVARRNELLLRAVTHNIMICCNFED